MKIKGYRTWRIYRRMAKVILKMLKGSIKLNSEITPNEHVELTFRDVQDHICK
jgi:hypothetical protein